MKKNVLNKRNKTPDFIMKSRFIVAFCNKKINLFNDSQSLQQIYTFLLIESFFIQ